MVMFLALVSSLQRKKRLSTTKRRGNVKRRRQGDVLVAPEKIPLELQIEIMTRLLGKSLMSFKCLSKFWSCFIRSRYFSNLCLTVASPQRPPRVYMSLVDHQACDSKEEVCHNPQKARLLSLSSSSSSDSADESLEPDLTIPGMGGQDMVVLRGLILYTVCRKAIIYNPATRQSVTLPAVKSDIFAQEESEKHVNYFLGHDPVLDQYKVVCTAVTWSEVDDFETLNSEHWVFVLEAGGSWKKVEFDQQPHIPTKLGLCINGVIYYLASTWTSSEFVISFDVRSEEFNMVQTPGLGKYVGFIEYVGKPTVFDHTHLRQNGLVDLWVMEDDGGSWSKKSLVLKPCQMHLVNGITDLDHLYVESATQNGEIILVPRPMPSPNYFLYYDPQKNHLRKVNVSGIFGHDGFGKVYIFFKHMDKSGESIMHLET
ncbi:hypothetical protein EUTSA_v10005275mg [Eutrema salsugineum]|uniref:F-box associated beta-propeller type 3 domain-containing protein n=1 Tax=Eutrema salsugineum TaxID=72664 RepID=V4KWC5_EUTSA|nr:putative F-box protein At5g62660 [Eutrema salsugineum]ESQ31658.1 hypothetical protein EUTSA_v10005275mg [Eutrema salsugineum]